MTQETIINNETANAHFGILLNPKNVLDIEDLKMYLFSIGVEFEVDFNKSIISDRLKEEFESKSVHITESVKITKQKDNEWIMTDKKNIYIVEKDVEKLNVYRQIQDQFGFEKKKPEFINYVNEYLGDRKSIVAGIYGDYGSGKSVFVNLVKNEVELKDLKELSDTKQRIHNLKAQLESEKDEIKKNKLNDQLKKAEQKGKFIVFHAWKYKDEQSIWRNFILDVSNKLQDNKKNKELKDSIYYSEEKSVPNKKEILHSLMGLALIVIVLILVLLFANFEESINNIILLVFSIISTVFIIFRYHSTKRIKQPMSSLEEFEDKFRGLINGCEHDKIYIAIENIDRCLPHQSIRLLESLKAFLENNDDNQLEKDIIFLIPCDKSILQLAIKNECGDSDVLNASTYLDKLIQLPYDLPVPSNNSFRDYIESILYDGLSAMYLEKISDMLELGGITNPREVKILFREWEMRFVNLDRELKYPIGLDTHGINLDGALILLKLLILKKNYPEVYGIYLDIASIQKNVDTSDVFDRLANDLFEDASHLANVNFDSIRNGMRNSGRIDDIKRRLEGIIADIPMKKSLVLDLLKYGNIKPTSFEHFKKFMLTTKSAKETKSQEATKTNDSGEKP